MHTRTLVFLIALIALAAAACSDDAVPRDATGTPTTDPLTQVAGTETSATGGSAPVVTTVVASPTATASSTPTVTQGIGDAAIDRVIEAVDARDVAALRSMVRMQETACVEEPAGLGGPPQCAPGEADGAIVSVFPVSVCEGTFSRHPGATLGTFVHSSRGLYAVTRGPGVPRSEPFWPLGDTLLVFHAERGGGDVGQRLVLEDGAIVAAWYGCGPIADTLSWRGEPLTLIAGPFDEMGPAPSAPPRSGEAGVDATIAAVATYDVISLMERTVMAAAACVERPTAPAEVACNASKGEAPGEIVAVLPVARCDGEFSRDRRAVYAELLDRQPRVVALQESIQGEPDHGQWVSGTHVLTLELGAPSATAQAAQLVLDEDGRIAVVWYGCNAGVDELMARGGASLALTEAAP